MADRFQEALQYATELHAGQLRKGTQIPYVAHLLSVAGIVLDYGGAEDEAIAVLLNDSIEDQGGAETGEEIEARFGEAVFEIVMGCSDATILPKPPWRERKEAYLAHVVSASRSVRLVCAADKLHNVRSILMDYQTVGEALWSRFNGDRDGTLWYYRALVSAYRSAGSTALVDELDRVVLKLEKMCGSLQ